MSREEAVELIVGRVLSSGFARAVLQLTGVDKGRERVTVRPVALKDGQRLQVASFNGRKTTTKNYLAGELEVWLRGVVFGGELRPSVTVFGDGEEVSLTFSRKGRPIITRRASAVAVPELAHDRTVARLLPEGTPDPFLMAAGLMTADGRIRADKQRKFRQVNEFLRAILDVVESGWGERPLILDFGCGNAYLTLALHYYLNAKMGLAVELIGVDLNADVVARDLARVSDGDVRFVASAIAAFEPPRRPDVVVALHACDTATDDALAAAVRARARFVFAAPCCHHHLQAQLSVDSAEAGVRPMLRDGILRERLGDVVTDTFRALALRMAGYQVDAIQFVEPEHTPRNVMLRGRYTGKADERARAEFEALKKSFCVSPYIEQLMQGSDGS